MDRVDPKAPLVHIFDMSNRRVREAHMQDLVVFDMARTTVMEAERLAIYRLISLGRHGGGLRK